MKRSRRVRFLGISVVFVTAIAVASIASADTWVHVNFGKTRIEADLVGPSGGSGETWNQAGTSTSDTDLTDSAGGATTIDWSLSGSLTTNGEMNRADELEMLESYFYQSDGSARILTISGLNPTSKYALYIASFDQNSWGSSSMTFSTANTTTTVGAQVASSDTQTSWIENDNYVLFEGLVPDGSSEIVISGFRSSGAYGFWNGFQLREIVASQGVSVDLDNSTVASNAVPGTLVGTISDPLGHATSFVLTNAPAGGSAAENDNFQITDGTNLRTRVWMSQYSNNVSIAGISNGVALVTNSLPITLTAAGNPVFRVSAETSNPPSDGDVVGTMMVDNDSGATFAIVAGRTDLFTQDGNDNLLVTNAASWTGVGSTNWVTIRATTGTGTSDLAIGVSVVSGVASATVFRFM